MTTQQRMERDDEIIALLYLRKPMKEISRLLGIPYVTVTQRVNQMELAGKRIRRVIEPPPPRVLLQARLRDKYHCLRLVRVAMAPGKKDMLGSDDVKRLVGQCAATAFDDCLKSTQDFTVGIAGSTAVAAMIPHLKPRRLPDLRIVGLDAFTHPEVSHSAAGLVAACALNYEVPSELALALPFAQPNLLIAPARPVQDPYWEKIRGYASDVDVALVGIGDPGAKGMLHRVLAFWGEEMTTEERERSVGDIRYRLLDEQGNTVSERFERFSLLSAETIRNRMWVTHKEERLIVAVASGDNKVAAIRATLNGKYINGLITDEHTARALLGEDSVGAVREESD